MDCPLDCPYLQEARKHEPPAELDPEKIPNRDIDVPEGFLQDHDALLGAMGHAILEAAFENGARDSDLRDAIEPLIRTYRTLESGVYYETRPVNAIAGRIFDSIQSAVVQYRDAECRELGMSRTRDADVLRLLVLLQRLELTSNNGRPRGRAALDTLRTAFGWDTAAAQRPTPSLILP